MMNPSSYGRCLRVLAMAAGLAMTLCSLARANSNVELNGNWLFRIDPRSEGEKAGWNRTVPDGTESV